jgi:hypothetical protein
VNWLMSLAWIARSSAANGSVTVDLIISGIDRSRYFGKISARSEGEAQMATHGEDVEVKFGASIEGLTAGM